MTNYFTFIRANFPLLSFGFLTVFWGNFGQSFFIAWFGAEIQSSLGLSASRYGFVYSSATLLSALLVVWLGALIDRVSVRSYAIFVSLGLALASFLLTQATGLVSLLLAFILLRLFGQALLPHTGITTMTRCFENGRGKAVSIVMTGVPLGEIILPLLAVAIISYAGWQSVYLLISLLTLLVLLPAVWFLGGKIQDGPHTQGANTGAVASGKGPGRRIVLRDIRYWLVLPALMANPFLITGIFIHQNFLLAGKDWTVAWLASCFIVYGIVHWISSLLSGSLVDRFTAVKMLPFMQLPMLLALLLIAFVPGWWTAPAIMSLLGMSSGSAPPVNSSLWVEIYGTGSLGSIRAMNMAIMVFATAVSPVLFGYAIDGGMTLTGLFAYSALYVALAAVLLFFSYPLHPHPAGQMNPVRKQQK
ncbi:MAG: MFS transporter [Pseudomonadales bacterium]|nr:MFS transporter [Pseudomonadales bacterium]